MRPRATLLSAAVIAAVALPGHTATGHTATGHTATRGTAARCVKIDRLALDSAQAAATVRYWTPSRTKAAAKFSQASLAKELKSPRPLKGPQPRPELTRLCAPATNSVDHGTTRAPAAPSSHQINGYKTVGKFFFTVAGFPFNCTAVVIGRAMIVTAAHCFMGNNPVNYTTSNWMFAPMWHNNTFPYGKWYVSSVYIMQPYINSFNGRYDFAAVNLDRQHGHGVAYYTGQDSWSGDFSLARDQTTGVRIVGIPGNSSVALTSVTTAVAVEVSRRWEVLRASTPGFGDGTSGGPWFHPFDTKTDTGTVLGVTGGYEQGGDTDSPSYADFFSSYFTDLVAAANKGIKGCNSTGDCRYWP
jgi:hypothetical protein